jgi:hypothetical protein
MVSIETAPRVGIQTTKPRGFGSVGFVGLLGRTLRDE